jgi:serine/threonine-protein kinase
VVQVSGNGNDLLGRTLGGYVLEAKIGSGATGVVYRARRGAEERPVAVKVLNENLGHISSLRRRFEREARALSRLAHPRIVHIGDFGVTEEATFIAMEFLEGDTLEEILQDGPVAPESAVTILRQVLDGVAFAHELQIVHRDLKPANIFLQFAMGAPDVKVLDFGLAKFLSIDELSQDATLTRRGRIVGTPAYMAPEQITGVSLDVRADVYAAGVVLFELLADRRPFDYARRSQLLRAHLFEPVPALGQVRPGLSVHPELEAVVHKALAKDPNERFANAGEMLRALERLPEAAVRLDDLARSRQRERTAVNSAFISEGERRAVTTGVESPSATESSDRGPLVPPGAPPAVAARGARAGAPPRDTLVDPLPLGTLPPRRSPGVAAAASEDDGALWWWLGGVVLSGLVGTVAFFVVRFL